MNAVLGGQAARRQPEFLQCIRKRQREAGGGRGIVVHRAVEQVCHAEPLPSGHRYVHAALKAAGVRLAGLDGRARQEDEVGDLTALQRELHNPLVLDHGPDARALDIDERRRGFNGHRLVEIPEREHDIDNRSSRYLEHDAGLHRGAKPRQHGLQPIRAR